MSDILPDHINGLSGGNKYDELDSVRENSVDWWLSRVFSASDDENKLSIFHEAFLHSREIPDSEREAFRLQLLRAVEEEFGNSDTFLAKVREVEKGIEKTEELGERIPKQIKDILAPNTEEKDDIDRYVEILGTYLQSLTQLKNEFQIEDGVVKVNSIFRVVDKSSVLLSEFQRRAAEKIAEMSKIVCSVCTPNQDNTEDSSPLMYFTPVLEELFSHVLRLNTRADLRSNVSDALAQYVEQNKKNFQRFPKNYEQIFRFSASLSTQSQEEVIKLFSGLFSENLREALHCVANLFSPDDDKYSSDPVMREVIINKVLFGDDPDQIVPINELLHVYEQTGTSKWQNPEQGLRLVLRSNIEALYKLEQERHGAAKYLYSERGIHHFNRYPNSLLINQYDTRENIPKSGYVEIILPRSDHNFGFNMYREFEELIQTMPEGLELRIIEVGSARELLARCNKAVRKYGRASGAFVGAHGSVDSMEFGREDDGVLSSDDLEEGVQLTQLALEKFLLPNATLVLLSCFTGAEGGIAENLAQKGIKVIAPDEETGSDTMLITQNGPEITLDVVYGNSAAKKTFIPHEKLKSEEIPSSMNVRGDGFSPFEF